MCVNPGAIKIPRGKIRHLEVSHLWIQGTAAEKRLKYGKVAGSSNPADMLTKGLEACKREEYIEQLGLVKMTGRASIAPMLHTKDKEL